MFVELMSLICGAAFLQESHHETGLVLLSLLLRSHHSKVSPYDSYQNWIYLLMKRDIVDPTTKIKHFLCFVLVSNVMKMFMSMWRRIMRSE